MCTVQIIRPETMQGGNAVYEDIANVITAAPIDRQAGQLINTTFVRFGGAATILGMNNDTLGDLARTLYAGVKERVAVDGPKTWGIIPAFRDIPLTREEVDAGYGEDLENNILPNGEIVLIKHEFEPDTALIIQQVLADTLRCFREGCREFSMQRPSRDFATDGDFVNFIMGILGITDYTIGDYTLHEHYFRRCGDGKSE